MQNVDELAMSWVTGRSEPPSEAMALLKQYSAERNAYEMARQSLELGRKQLAELEQDLIRREATTNCLGEMLKRIAAEELEKKTSRNKKEKTNAKGG